MNEDIRIAPDDYREIQPINWNGPVRLADDKVLTGVGELCPRYLPCPICRKCCNKASHLFEKCAGCAIPLCIHSDRERNLMIKRRNFAFNISKDAMDALDVMAADALNRRKQAV